MEMAGRRVWMVRVPEWWAGKGLRSLEVVGGVTGQLGVAAASGAGVRGE